MKVLVTGATGFVGSNVVKQLLEDGHEPVGMVRVEPPKKPDIEFRKGDVAEPESLLAACSGMEAVVHTIGLAKETRNATFDKVVVRGTQDLLTAASEAGVGKFSHVSALGTRPNAGSRYHQTKWQAEEAVRNSGLRFTIVRPSIIYGPGDGFVSMFAGRIVPLPGGGKTMMQPVYVKDVATVLSRSLTLPESDGQTYDLVGPTRHTMREVIEIAERVYGKKGFHPSMPMWMAALGAKLIFDPLNKLGIEMPASTDQLQMLEEMNVSTDEELERTRRTFGIEPTPLEEGLRKARES